MKHVEEEDTPSSTSSSSTSSLLFLGVCFLLNIPLFLTEGLANRIPARVGCIFENRKTRADDVVDASVVNVYVSQAKH